MRTPLCCCAPAGSPDGNSQTGSHPHPTSRLARSSRRDAARAAAALPRHLLATAVAIWRRGTLAPAPSELSSGGASALPAPFRASSGALNTLVLARVP